MEKSEIITIGDWFNYQIAEIFTLFQNIFHFLDIIPKKLTDLIHFPQWFFFEMQSGSNRLISDILIFALIFVVITLVTFYIIQNIIISAVAAGVLSIILFFPKIIFIFTPHLSVFSEIGLIEIAIVGVILCFLVIVADYFHDKKM